MNLEKSKATMKQLDERFLDCTRALEAMEKKKQQYKHQFQKSSKQAHRLEQEKTELTEKQEELVQEIQRLEILA